MKHPPIKIKPETLIADIEAVFEQCRPLLSRAAIKHSYCVADHTFDVLSDLKPYMKAVDVAWAGKATFDPPGAQIFVGVAGDAACPVLLWDAPYFEERQIEAMLTSTRYRMHYYHPLAFWQIYDRETSTGFQIMKARDQYPAWDLGSPLRNFLQWELASQGGALIHAGTLAVGEKGILLAGKGGSGKSGTVLSGVLSGLQTVGDDYVYALPKSQRAFPLFDTLKQDEDGLKRLGLLGNSALPQDKNWQDKYQFSIPDLDLPSQPESISLHALLLPHIAHQDVTQITPIPAKQAFLALAPSGVSQIPGDRAYLYATAAEISRTLPCFQLHLGRDPDEISAVIRQFILDI